jgi:mercuric ion transport protein
MSSSSGATQKMNEEKTPWILGIVGGTIASLCCIGPLVIFFFGVGSISTALSIGKYTPFFLAAAIIFMGIAFYFHLKKKK